MPLTDEDILKWCGADPATTAPSMAVKTVEALGGLGLWGLDPKIVKTAIGFYRQSGREPQAAFLERFTRPKLPKTQGACWVIVAVQDNHALPALRQGFPVPLQWDRKKPHDSRLPAALKELATLVREDVSRQIGDPLDDWGLSLCDECGFSSSDDLSQLRSLTWESGWVSLAAGLITGVEAGLANPDVWATARWSNGVQPVGNILLKAQAAADFGASTLFIPRDNMPEVAGHAFGTLKIAPLLEGGTYKAALDPYLDQMKEEPGPSAPREQCEEYFLNLRDGMRAERFYDDRLRPLIAEDLREKLGNRCMGITELVTVVSLRPATILLAADVLQPRRVLLFYTPVNGRIADACSSAAKELENRGLEALPVPIVDDGTLGAVAGKQIDALGVAPEKIVFDLTPGTKWMTLALTIAAPENSYLVYWWHRSKEGSMRIVPGTETPFVWKKGAGFTLEPV